MLSGGGRDGRVRGAGLRRAARLGHPVGRPVGAFGRANIAQASLPIPQELQYLNCHCPSGTGDDQVAHRRPN